LRKKKAITFAAVFKVRNERGQGSRSGKYVEMKGEKKKGFNPGKG
jgi:hypothetical protein